MSSSYDDSLNALGVLETPLPEADLSALSDLDAAQLLRLRQVWSSLDAERRRDIIGEIGRLAQVHIELNFDRVDRLALEDPDDEVRRRAIGNLWESEDPTLAASLLEMLRADPDLAVRAAAAAALATFVYLGEVESLPNALLGRIEQELLRSALEGDTSVRQRSLESLGFSSRSEVPSLIRAAYQSPEESWKRSSLVAMARSADEAWARDVEAELRSPAPGIRLEAARAAGELELRTSVQELMELLEDADTLVRRAAIWSLGQIGGKRAAEVLGRLLDEGDDEEASLVQDALDHLAFVEGSRDFGLPGVDEDTDEEEEEETP